MMDQSIRRLAVFCTALIVLSACKKQFDEFYERPASLEPPIYQQLEARGNFKSILAAIDKAGYKQTLSAAGYWTFFAPNDSAFKVYLTSKSLNSVSDLDSTACREIVNFSLVYNAFRKERLDDYQGATGWIPSMAFKRRTTYYTFVYDGKDVNGRPIKVVPMNRNAPAAYADADNNNKYIPYFVNEYMASAKLTAADYNYFYPNTPYTGFNVVDAAVTEQDIAAENGVIHIVNKVITALPSIDQYLEGKAEYSEFKKLFDQFLVQYMPNPGVTRRYQVTTGKSDSVFTKVYTAPFGTLAYNLNNESFVLGGNDAQTDGYSIFVPTNDVLTSYVRNTLLENYPAGTTLKDVPISIVYDFVNAHLWQKAVWPSKFESSTNYLGEQARFNPVADIAEKKILSNGMFYGTKKVQEANVFTSVYGRAYLDPKYSMMAKLLNFELKSVVSDISRNYTMFMISDAMWNAAGFTHDASISNNIYEQYRYTPPAGSTIPATTGAGARNRMLRIMYLHIVPTRVLDNLGTETAALTIGGEYIGIRNNTLFSSGNLDSNNVVNTTATKTSKNGRVYYIDRMLNFTENLVGAQIERLGTTPSTAASPYNYFWEFLKTSSLWNATTKEITGVSNGTFYTLFMPNNAAIMQAVRDGVLPGTVATGVPNFNAATQTNVDKENVVRFIYHHFIDRRIVAADGVELGSMSTLLKTNIGDATTVFVNNNPGVLQLTDMNNRISNVISGASTYMGNRIMIHLIDNYLKYTL